MLILTGIRSVGFAFSTINSDCTSGVMKNQNSVTSIRKIKMVQQMEMMAPATVG
uniref:Uncharacterized protein n=1 Tax=Lepeophtheirus salmonis TaxID=72036 RepID=A0A0K2TS07_LEPSM